jgi:hypothetical protein
MWTRINFIFSKISLILPFYKIGKLLKFLQISFGNRKNSGT